MLLAIDWSDAMTTERSAYVFFTRVQSVASALKV